MSVINLPLKSDIRLPKARRNHKSRPVAKVIKLETAIAPDTSRSAFEQASLLDETDPSAAIPMYEAIIARHDHNQALATVNLGNCYFRLREKEMAEACYRRALELEPSEPNASYNLGYLELERGFYGPALTLLRRATELDPTFSDAWFNRGMAAEYAADGPCPEARLCFGRYLRSGTREPMWDEIAKQHLAR